MDLNLFSKMLKELITVNDKVSVPGLGYFFVEDIPASFSDRGYTVNPPYRKLSFRADEYNDGLLEQLYIASNPDICPREASRALNEFIAETKTQLLSDKSVLLPGLGKLRATRENNLFFVADENAALFPQYDFLEPVSLRTRQVSTALPEKPVLPESSVLPENPEISDVTEMSKDSHIKMSAFSKVCLWILAVAVLFFAALAILGRLYPDIVDPLLYSPEQLTVIRYRL